MKTSLKSFLMIRVHQCFWAVDVCFRARLCPSRSHVPSSDLDDECSFGTWWQRCSWSSVCPELLPSPPARSARPGSPSLDRRLRSLRPLPSPSSKESSDETERHWCEESCRRLRYLILQQLGFLHGIIWWCFSKSVLLFHDLEQMTRKNCSSLSKINKSKETLKHPDEQTHVFDVFVVEFVVQSLFDGLLLFGDLVQSGNLHASDYHLNKKDLIRNTFLQQGHISTKP